MREKETLSHRLRVKGLKVTPQRISILKVLNNSYKHICRWSRYNKGEKKHLCAEGIYRDAKKIHPSVSLNTVYTTLKTLRDKGELTELNFGEDRNRYEIETTFHNHIICVKCSRIEEIPQDERLAPKPPESITANYEMLGHRLFYYVICPACRSNENDSVRNKA